MNAPGLPLLLLLNFNSIKVRLELGYALVIDALK